MITKIITIISVALMNLNGRNSVKPYVKKSDLPSEFSDEALKTINDFISETRDLNYEMGMFFDYKTGKKIKIFEGEYNNVELNYNLDEFKHKNIASIHNHHINLLSPPSSKNFGILGRKFEDYELIAGYNDFWIFEAKGLQKGLLMELRNYSDVLFTSLEGLCSIFYSGDEMYDKIEEEYGKQLSEYINNKHIENLKLTKVRYNYDS